MQSSDCGSTASDEAQSIDDVDLSELTLYGFQEQAVKDIYKRFTDKKDPRGCQIITAEKGTGKTYIGLAVAKLMQELCGMKALLVVNINVADTFRDLAKQIGLDLWDVVTWQSLAGRKGKVISGKGTKDEVRKEATLNHPWLLRDNGTTGPFYGTVKYQEACRKGLFLLCDESQAAKNDTSAASWAVSALVNTGLGTEDARFRCLHMTALFIDSKKAYSCLYRILGCTNGKDKMYHHNARTGVYEWLNHGFGSVYEEARKTNANKTKGILQKYFKQHSSPRRELDYIWRLDRKQVDPCLTEMWEQVLRDKFQVHIEDQIYLYPDGSVIPFVRRNSFYELPAEDIVKCTSAISALKRAHIVNDEGGVDMQKAKDNIALVQSALMKLAEAKVSALLRVVKERLAADPTIKVIVVYPFVDGQEKLVNQLDTYGALIYNGKVPPAERKAVRDKFNEPTLKHRVIIMSPQVGGVGISAHDHIEPTPEQFEGLKHLFDCPANARFPRVQFNVPTFHYMLQFQSTGRAYRAGLRSQVEVNFFYACNAPLESVLMNTMIKSAVGKGSLSSKKRLFPHEYQIYIENEKPEHAPLRSIMQKIKTMSVEELEANKKG